MILVRTHPHPCHRLQAVFELCENGCLYISQIGYKIIFSPLIHTFRKQSICTPLPYALYKMNEALESQMQRHTSDLCWCECVIVIHNKDKLYTRNR